MSEMKFPPFDDPIDPTWWAPLEAVAAFSRSGEQEASDDGNLHLV